jgi:hypothetical protein
LLPRSVLAKLSIRCNEPVAGRYRFGIVHFDVKDRSVYVRSRDVFVECSILLSDFSFRKEGFRFGV